MNELHDSGVGAHGNLSSYNILLDNRWLCKIADFGLEKFKDMSDLGPKKIPELSEEEKYKSKYSKFWLLRNQNKKLSSLECFLAKTLFNKLAN